MPVYFGLPLTISESIRILGLDMDSDILKIKKDYSSYYDHHLFIYLNKYLVDKQDKIATNNIIQIYSTDKGQYVLGYELIEISDVWNNIMSVDNMIILLLKCKNKFNKDIKLLNIDLSHVEIEHMENYPTYEVLPEPYILEWKY